MLKRFRDLLKKVIASRGVSATEPVDVNEFIHNPGESFLDEVAEIVAVASSRKDCHGDAVPELPDEVQEQLHHFVSTIAQLYRQNAFHSFQHASHVL